MLYRIGELAKLLGISQEALRLFERRGMISPLKNKKTGYRYYSELDISSMIRCRSYQRYGFSMNETADLMNTRDLDFVLSKYREREAALEASIDRETQMLSYLKSIREIVQALKTDYGVCRLAESPAFYTMPYMRNGELSLNEADFPIFSAWMDLVPFSSLSIRWEKDALLRGRIDYTASLCVPEAYAKALSYPLDPPVNFLPARPCVYMLTSESEGHFEASCFDPMLDFCKENRLGPADDPYCRSLSHYRL